MDIVCKFSEDLSLVWAELCHPRDCVPGTVSQSPVRGQLLPAQSAVTLSRALGPTQLGIDETRTLSLAFIFYLGCRIYATIPLMTVDHNLEISQGCRPHSAERNDLSLLPHQPPVCSPCLVAGTAISSPTIHTRTLGGPGDFSLFLIHHLMGPLASCFYLLHSARSEFSFSSAHLLP